MTEGRWAAIDFETATREPTSACAVGIALVDGLQVTRTLSWLVQPPFNEYEFWNTNVHGISAEDTRDAPEFADVWWEIRAALDGRTLLAHNAPFDMRVLRALIRSRELTSPDYAYACTVAMSRKALPQLQKHRLDTVCDHCGITLVHHDAASDAAACARVAIACAEAVGEVRIDAAMARLGVPIRTLGIGDE